MIKQPKPHKRSRKHYNSRGKAKIPYEDKSSAEKACERLGEGYVYYWCDKCSSYHIGRK